MASTLTVKYIGRTINRTFIPRFTNSLLNSQKNLNSLSIRFNSEIPRQKIEPIIEEEGKFKAITRKYGRAAIVVHVGFSFIDLAFWYFAIKNSMDVQGMLDYIGLGNFQEKLNPKVGAFALALIVHKATTIVRIPLTAFVTPFAAPYLNPYFDRFWKKVEERGKTPDQQTPK